MKIIELSVAQSTARVNDGLFMYTSMFVQMQLQKQDQNLGSW